MKHIKFLFLGLLSPLYFAVASYQPSCEHDLGDCRYYFCKEEIRHCGEHGYYINFGLRYCYAYQEIEKDFSPQGQKFLSDVRLCLQKAIEQDSHVSCSDLKPMAVWTHPDCYIDSGYCALSFEEKMRIVNVAKAEAFDLDVILAFSSVEASCL